MRRWKCTWSWGWRCQLTTLWKKSLQWLAWLFDSNTIHTKIIFVREMNSLYFNNKMLGCKARRNVGSFWKNKLNACAEWNNCKIASFRISHKQQLASKKKKWSMSLWLQSVAYKAAQKLQILDKIKSLEKVFLNSFLSLKCFKLCIIKIKMTFNNLKIKYIYRSWINLK